MKGRGSEGEGRAFRPWNSGLTDSRQDDGNIEAARPHMPVQVPPPLPSSPVRPPALKRTRNGGPVARIWFFLSGPVYSADNARQRPSRMDSTTLLTVGHDSIITSNPPSPPIYATKQHPSHLARRQDSQSYISGSPSLSGGTVAGIAIACFGAVLVAASFLVFFCVHRHQDRRHRNRRRRRQNHEQLSSGTESGTGPLVAKGVTTAMSTEPGDTVIAEPDKLDPAAPPPTQGARSVRSMRTAQSALTDHTAETAWTGRTGHTARSGGAVSPAAAIPLVSYPRPGAPGMRFGTIAGLEFESHGSNQGGRLSLSPSHAALSIDAGTPQPVSTIGSGTDTGTWSGIGGSTLPSTMSRTLMSGVSGTLPSGAGTLTLPLSPISPLPSSQPHRAPSQSQLQPPPHNPMPKLLKPKPPVELGTLYVPRGSDMASASTLGVVTPTEKGQPSPPPNYWNLYNFGYAPTLGHQNGSLEPAAAEPTTTTTGAAEQVRGLVELPTTSPYYSADKGDADMDMNMDVDMQAEMEMYRAEWERQQEMGREEERKNGWGSR